MDDFLFTRVASLNLWTLGHRRFYSPMLQAGHGAPSAGAMVTPQRRPRHVLWSAGNPEDDGARDPALSAGKNRGVSS
jgi:hypothetical protein